MNTLTEQERIGLEDVFLSISTPSSKIAYFAKFRHATAGLFKKRFSIRVSHIPQNMLLIVKKSFKKPAFPPLFNKIVKMKKKLSQ